MYSECVPNAFLLYRSNAASCLQQFTRWCLRRKRSLEKMRLRGKVEDTLQAMAQMQEEKRVRKIVYQQSLADWYTRRKEEYEKSRLRETQSAADKAMIATYRRKVKNESMLEKRRLKGTLPLLF